MRYGEHVSLLRGEDYGKLILVHTHTTKNKKKVAPNIPKKKDEEKEGEMEYLMDASQRKRSRGVAVRRGGETLLMPGGREGKEGGMKEEKCTSSCFFFLPSSHWPRVKSGSDWRISWAEAPPHFPPSSTLSGRVNGAKERDGAASLLLVLSGPPAGRWGGQVGQEC